MDLEIGKAYLCEVWLVPPELECNGTEARHEVMRFGGMMPGSGRTRTRRCDGKVIEVRENTMMEMWEVAGSSLPAGEMIWKVFPLRILEPDPIILEPMLVEETA